MSKGILRELTWLITSLWLALFVAWMSGWWWLTFSVYLLFYFARQFYSIYRFEQWMKGAPSVSYPPGSGFWGELGYLVSRKQRSLEKHADLQFYKSEQFLAASMALPDAIISLNENHQIEWFNHSAKKLFKLKHSDTHRKIENLFRHPEFIQYLKSEQYEKSLILPVLNGIHRAFSVRLFPYFKAHKLLIVKDIHELYNLAQIRRDFVANASHELRTPLTVLNGYIEVMMDGQPADSVWVKPLEQMHGQSVRMQSIINDLLTLSAMESETLVGKEKTVPVAEILQRMEQDVEQMSQGRHRFHFELDKRLALKGYEDPLKSVLMNLISNAIRYTPDKGDITVRWYRDEKGAHFQVDDTGIGIAQEHLSRLTERFYRVDTARSRDTGGTGLGLAIVKHILERHQAKLVIKSQYGKGSSFRCDFPLSKAVVTKPPLSPPSGAAHVQFG